MSESILKAASIKLEQKKREKIVENQKNLLSMEVNSLRLKERLIKNDATLLNAFIITKDRRFRMSIMAILKIMKYVFKCKLDKGSTHLLKAYLHNNKIEKVLIDGRYYWIGIAPKLRYEKLLSKRIIRGRIIEYSNSIKDKELYKKYTTVNCIHCGKPTPLKPKEENESQSD